MFCPSCHQENDDSNAFCIYCGVRLESASESSHDDSETAAIAELERDVRFLRQEITDIRATLATYGIRVEAQGQRQTPQPSRQPRQETATRPPVAAAAVSGAPSSPPPTTPRTPPRSSMPWDNVDWEVLLGGNWLARIGIVAVVIGVGFFLKMAFDNDWINETGRVILGIVGGLAFIGASEYWRKRYPAYAQALAGGGIAILYLSIFAAFAIFDLIGLYPAVGLLLTISVASAILALRHDSLALAIIGIFGAFVAPFITGAFGQASQDVSDAGPTVQLMIYVMLVDIGVLALSTFRNWRWFTLLALAGSLISFASWYGQYNDELSLLTVQSSLTGIFLIFVAATTLFHIVRRQVPQSFDYTLMLVNATAYVGISLGLLWDDFRAWAGGFTFLLAAFYGGIALLVNLRGKEQQTLSIMALGIAIIFLTAAIPIQLGSPWIGAVWAAEGAVLMWLSYRINSIELRISSLVVLTLLTIRLLAFDSVDALTDDVRPFLNVYTPTFLLSIAGFVVSAYIVHRNVSKTEAWERRIAFPALLGLGALFLTIGIPIQVDDGWVALGWVLEAVALVAIAFKLRIQELRFIGYGVFYLLAIRLIFIDTRVNLEDFRLIINHRMLAFVSSIAAAYAVSYLMHRYRSSIMDGEKVSLIPLMLIGANFLTLWVASAEVIAWVDSGIAGVTGGTADNVKSLSLSILWAVYASAALTLGVVKGWRMVRIGALALLAVPILKLFLFDSFELERGYRVAAFLALGALLLVGGFLYQKYSVAIRGFLFEDKHP